MKSMANSFRVPFCMCFPSTSVKDVMPCTFWNPELTCRYAIHRWEKTDGATVFVLNSCKTQTQIPQLSTTVDRTIILANSAATVPCPCSFPTRHNRDIGTTSTDYHPMTCDGVNINRLLMLLFSTTTFSFVWVWFWCRTRIAIIFLCAASFVAKFTG